MKFLFHDAIFFYHYYWPNYPDYCMSELRSEHFSMDSAISLYNSRFSDTLFIIPLFYSKINCHLRSKQIYLFFRMTIRDILCDKILPDRILEWILKLFYFEFDYYYYYQSRNNIHKRFINLLNTNNSSNIEN